MSARDNERVTTWALLALCAAIALATVGVAREMWGRPAVQARHSVRLAVWNGGAL